MVCIPDLKAFLDEKYEQYNRPEFIENDPVSIPHRLTKKEDIEISGFFSAMLAWGQRRTIVRNAGRLMDMMGSSPHDFILHASGRHFRPFRSFVHRTFNGADCAYFMRALKHIYCKHGDLENSFSKNVRAGDKDLCHAITCFRKEFFAMPHPRRTRKHIADPSAGASAKRFNMFLRWMVRCDNRGVDFGLWKSIRPAQLSCPLDIHTGRVARKLGLLKRKQNDWKAVSELTDNLRRFDPKDPVKYDFALFGLGMVEKWKE